MAAISWSSLLAALLLRSFEISTGNLFLRLFLFLICARESVLSVRLVCFPHGLIVVHTYSSYNMIQYNTVVQPKDHTRIYTSQNRGTDVRRDYGVQNK